jgi:hypothetical protein
MEPATAQTKWMSNQCCFLRSRLNNNQNRTCIMSCPEVALNTPGRLLLV